MSTELTSYLNFISSLKNATDEQIKDIISERSYFILLGKSDMMDHLQSGVNSVFDKIDSLAKELEEEEIAQESVRLAEDVAAYGAIWSFGLSLAACAALTAIDVVLAAQIKTKEEKLNKALKDADKDIAEKMGSSCSQYVAYMKKNTTFLKDFSPTGLSPIKGRSYLYSYMDFLSTHGGVGLANFRTHIDIAEETQNDPNTQKIYKILDEFEISGDHVNKSRGQIKQVLGEINSAGVNTTNLVLVRDFTYVIWVHQMKISAEALSKAAENVRNIPNEETAVTTYKNMNTLGKVTGAVTIVLSAVDALLNAYNIMDTVERYKENIKVFHNARKQYKMFYTELYNSSVEYKPN